ncbi:uncharacterized protein LOC120273263 [Dioscorea cayenensis subsp. rotundata]|uniref:Uncharacterized protein LOC120273263 n=1 Tax=Dioscorea cayennensis subsp. rotundata TaxID=55577 RepID=A0AB40CAJ0_DIOCR|nr:uncharacterized protein LOC120273263 [Dioscorea cayenensis subsp. rotundata]
MADAAGGGSRPKRALEGFEEMVDGEKRKRVKGSGTVSEGTRTYNSECLNVAECKSDGQRHKNSEVEAICQITEENVPTLLDIPINVPAVNRFHEQNAAPSSLGADGCQHFAEQQSNAPSKHHEEMNGSYPASKADKDCRSLTRTITGSKVGFTVIDASRAIEHNPFYPYKKLGQVKSTDTSECGSTTGPVEESEPLRMWKEMKQNGFLSSSHGGIPMPKQRGRHHRKDERA